MNDIPVFTTGERYALKRCPQRWAWAFRDGLMTQEMNTKYWFGIGIHLALAHFYAKGTRRKKDFINVWEAFCDEDEMSKSIRTRPNNELSETEWVEARELGIEMLKGYVLRYDWDRNWDVIYTEEPFAIEIPDAADPDHTAGIFMSTFDGVYRDKRDLKIKLMEHKTAASIQTAHLSLDDQAGAYWAVATIILRDKGVLGKRDRIDGITYNFLRKALPDPRPRDAEGHCLNKDGSISKIQPPPLFERPYVRRTPKERAKQIQNMQAELAVMNYFRSGGPLYKNPTRDCHWDCQFFNMCQLHEGGVDWEEFRDAVMIQVDPYSRYRKSAAFG